MRAYLLAFSLLTIAVPAVADEVVQSPVPPADTRVLPEFTRLDTDGNGRVTPAEFAAGNWRHRLDYYDKDHNGRISLAEYQQGTCFNEGPSTPENESVLAECRAGLAQEANGATEWRSGETFPELQFRFRLLDCNRDGVVTAQEYFVSQTARCPT